MLFYRILATIMPYMFATTFLDFDETLFHTQIFKNRLVEVFVRHGVPAEVVWQTFRPVENDGRESTYFDYTFEKHVKLLEEKGYLLPKGIIEELEGLLKHDYRMEGAEEFVHWTRSISSEVLILSSGDKEFQMKKIASSGLEKLVSGVIITHDHKEEIVKTLMRKDYRYLFINDNLDENKRVHEALPEVMVVSKINTFMFAEVAYRESGIPCFYTLEEIQNFITSSPY